MVSSSYFNMSTKSQRATFNRRQKRSRVEQCAQQNAEQDDVQNEVQDEVQSDPNVELSVVDLPRLKRKFVSNDRNLVLQNALCSSTLYQVAEVRDYMQSRDSEFSHTLDPELVVSNQGLSGRCWLFALLNVMRHELVRKFKLQRDFELSEAYVCFYEKYEKCNHFLSRFLTMDNIDPTDYRTQRWLMGGCQDGGHWITCANLIKKYGIIPKSSYRESINSYHTGMMNDMLDYKLREFAQQMVAEPDNEKRLKMKSTMMETVYEMLCKFLGTPPNPNEKFTWSFGLYLELNDQLERENKRRKTDGQFENLQIKQTLSLTPLEFYNDLIVNKLDNYMKFGNDPRNAYHKFYFGHEEDVVVEGERPGYYNLPMEEIAKLCVTSIKNNTPIEFDCDVVKYLNARDELMDTKCFNYNLVFDTDFNDLDKKRMMERLESYPNHAMVLVGVDLDESGNPIKWKVENSWGRDEDNENSTGYYTMSHDWFLKFVFNVVIQEDFVPRALKGKYRKAFKNATVLPENDIMSN
ncbi:C1B-like aminopeptidase [Yasminevirus sp. GU-2018]|uniref:C1B-like aminopeptidase n=1 Tax=Yasminevirus sp. GU-2018 TaxID=2420051 RepID=A0A5K0U7E4_9VIRU|nr:C1B-like aminopeptidase [Yasminevirus sp. GU-2018]